MFFFVLFKCSTGITCESLHVRCWAIWEWGPEEKVERKAKPWTTSRCERHRNWLCFCLLSLPPVKLAIWIGGLGLDLNPGLEIGPPRHQTTGLLKQREADLKHPL